MYFSNFTYEDIKVESTVRYGIISGDTGTGYFVEVDFEYTDEA